MDLETYRAKAEHLNICSRPIFIMGSPRSGTHILAVCLGMHSQLCNIGESELLFPLFSRDPVTPAVQMLRGLAKPNWLSKFGVEPGEVLAYIGLGINALFASKNPGMRWIDKTPHYTLMAETLAEMFPDAFFLYLLRDGRRVVHSMMHFLDRFPKERRTSLFPRGQLPPWATNFPEACKTWNRFVDVGTSFAAKHPDRCRTVINERLVSDPAREFSSIFQFLEVSEEKLPVHFYKGSRINSSFAETPPELTAEEGSSAAGAPRQDKPMTFVEWMPYKLEEPWQTWTTEQKQVFADEAGAALVRCAFATEEDMAAWRDSSAPAAAS
jgi:hypothetical protein